MNSLGWITPSLMLYEHDTLIDLVNEVFLISNIKQFSHNCIQVIDLWDMQVKVDMNRSSISWQSTSDFVEHKTMMSCEWSEL